MHMSPRRLLHGLPMPKRLEPPVQQELRLLLLLRYGGHDPFIESGRQAVGLDIGDEAGPVLLREQSFNVLGLARHGDFQLRYAVIVIEVGALFGNSRQGCTRISCARSATLRVDESNPANWRRVTSSRARRMAAFTRCHAPLTRHWRSMPHWLDAPLHSVMAIGPSNTSRICAAVICSGARARRYPPCEPREEITMPARCSPLSTLLTVGRLKRVRSASSAAARWRAGSCARLASTTVA